MRQPPPCRTPLWARSPHLQTLFPVMFRNRPQLDLASEQLELADGDFLDLCWSKRGTGPLVLVIHGLEGSIHSHYAAGVMHTLEEHGYRPVFMHFRGCSGRPNRLDRSYHSGDTGDIAAVVKHISEKAGEPVLAAVGFSLGGNALCKWLGESGARNPLEKAVAVSVPYRLADADKRLNTGISRLYREYLLFKLRASYRRKFKNRPSPLTVDVGKLRSFYEFDDKVTAPLHGFESADHYYAVSSCRQYLGKIQTPTLLIHAADDPFMYPDSAPTTVELPANVRLQLLEHGGHVGFICSRYPWHVDYHHEKQIIAFLNEG